jgi:hypothetical protein
MLQTNAEDIERWRGEASQALVDLRSAVEGGPKTAGIQQVEDRMLFVARVQQGYRSLSGIEQRLHDLARHSGSREQLAALVQSEFMSPATTVSSALDQLVQDLLTDMQTGITRLSGNLDGIVLYSGKELRTRAEFMNDTARKEILAGL